MQKQPKPGESYNGETTIVVIRPILNKLGPLWVWCACFGREGGANPLLIVKRAISDTGPNTSFALVGLVPSISLWIHYFKRQGL